MSAHAGRRIASHDSARACQAAPRAHLPPPLSSSHDVRRRDRRQVEVTRDPPPARLVPRHAGGCFHSDNAALVNLTQKSRPRPELCDPNHRGYVGNLFNLINQTWPHKDHMFLNAGVSGAPAARRPPPAPPPPLATTLSWRLVNPSRRAHPALPTAACGLSCTANSWCSEGFLPRDHEVDLIVFSDATQPGNNPWGEHTRITRVVCHTPPRQCARVSPKFR